MTDNFDYSYPYVLNNEKGNTSGWTNDPDDSGAESYCGISRRYWPNWPGWRLIDIAKGSSTFPVCLGANGNLPGLVEEFYRQNFWKPAWDQLDKRVAAKVFDVSVNCGESWGPKILQRALGVADDGVVGPHTVEAANNMDTDTLLAKMCEQMDKHYEAIVAAHPVDQKFLDNWESRASCIPTA